ncbi:putative urease accessory protein [Phialemonium atrogriseum]|uniref:Urease accessory protein n=1 Tax=Phialemonium atrogriseum TaxID=1093897 RepID=A0AAJ0C5U4_9PEZI|nr:putative urease accessory protein [Phialemonium atrogriseum]KAK1770515.1 putative urease accessory protein [Phialemonium atrogriseum]
MVSPFPKSSSVPGHGQIVASLLPNGAPKLETLSYQYPLKLISPTRFFEKQSVLVFLLSYGGGLLGGDSVSLSIEVKERSRLSIVTQGHTRIYKSASADIVTRQTLHGEVASGGGLCILPDPVQPFANSVYEQTQIFRVADNGSLCLLDWVTQGRSARGEDWDLIRWVGRNEVWATGGSPEARDRLLVRDTVILNADQTRYQTKSLRDTMHGMGIFGTLILRGPLMKDLGQFFLAEFAILPRIGARDFRSDGAKSMEDAAKSPLEEWRSERIKMEKSKNLLWSAANVRGCVVVKFGAPEVETGRVWVGSMLAQEGSLATNFGKQALMCVR